jgi:hypothetical protein
MKCSKWSALVKERVSITFIVSAKMKLVIVSLKNMIVIPLSFYISCFLFMDVAEKSIFLTLEVEMLEFLWMVNSKRNSVITF